MANAELPSSAGNKRGKNPLWPEGTRYSHACLHQTSDPSGVWRSRHQNVRYRAQSVKIFEDLTKRLHTVDQDSNQYRLKQAEINENLANRMKNLEDSLQIMSRPVPAAESLAKEGSYPESRAPSLAMGGWQEMRREELLEQVGTIVHQLQLDLEVAQASVVGITKLRALLPRHRQCESAEQQRARAINSHESRNASLSVDGMPGEDRWKLRLTILQPPQRRKQSKLAGKVKCLTIDAGRAVIKPNLEAEWFTGSLWFNGGTGAADGIDRVGEG